MPSFQRARSRSVSIWWGRAVAFGSRWIVLGVMPVFYVLMLGLTAATGWLSGGETAVGEIPAAQLILGFAIMATHVFELWLLLRWVRDGEER